jgi:hypothetical protein
MVSHDEMVCFLELNDWRNADNERHPRNVGYWTAPNNYPDRIRFKYWTIENAYELAKDPDSPYIFG